MTTTEKKVQKQYTEYTYPKYQKKWDQNSKSGPTGKSPITLQIINHYIYQGKQSFKNFRVLVAGCGLGTDLINLAMDLKKYNGEVVGIDLSPSSLAILKKRLKFYNIKNVTLHQQSILDLNPKKMGLFDHINCIGVLHHLKDPVAGLKKLRSVLKEDGSINMMVYAQYGRVGVYRMQELLKQVNKYVPDYETKIDNFKKIYANLPQTHLLKRFENVINDHNVNDNGIVDELLHCQDRAYTIPELYKYVESCNLNIVSHINRDTRQKLTKPIQTIDYKNMTQIEKETINELHHGDIVKHNVLLSPMKKAVPTIHEQDYIPVFNYITKPQIHSIKKILESDPVNIVDIKFMKTETVNRNGMNFTYYHQGVEQHFLNFILHKFLLQFLEYIDEKRSTQQILTLLKTKDKASNEEVIRVVNWMNRFFIQKDIILLKHPSSN